VRQAHGLIVVMCALVLVGSADAAGKPPGALKNRGVRIARLLPGWREVDATGVPPPCPVGVVAKRKARYAPSFYSPKSGPLTEIDLTLASWPDASTAAAAVADVVGPNRFGCLRSTIERRYGGAVALTFDTARPSWLQPVPIGVVRVLTTRISEGATTVFNTSISFQDATNRTVTWALAFDYRRSPPPAVVSRLLRAAES
jgi:hypothetical protein